MGKNIEYALAEDIERDLRERGYQSLRGLYIPTAKNKPVEGLYESLGYRRIHEADGLSEPEQQGQSGNSGRQGPEPSGQWGRRVYELELAKSPSRMYYVRMEDET